MAKKLSKRKKKWIERTIANDRSNKWLLYNRFYLFALLALLQIAGFLYLQYLFVYHSRLGVSLQAGVGIVSIVCVLYIINKGAHSSSKSSKLAWIVVILIAPVFGVPCYVYFGEGRPARKMQKRLAAAKAENRSFIGELGKIERPIPQTREEGIERYLTEYAFSPAYQNSDIVYFESGEKLFPAMKEELKKAEKFILLEYFIIAHGKMWGEILKIILRKAEEGVQIRIIYDDFGCMTTLPPDYDRYLESLHENIRATAFNEVVPVLALRMNNRDHRKMLVVDGKVAFTGGVNLADEYIGERRRFGHWKDSGVQITGNAAQSLVRMFFDMWNAFRADKEELKNYLSSDFNATLPPAEARKGTVQPYDDSPLDGRSVGEWVYADIIDRATKYVYIFTPYLLPDETIRSALVRAAERGVDVRIVTPGIPDKRTVYRLTRANYPSLLAAGVRIYEYTPGFIHSKSIVVDDECAVVGTINFDCRSLYLHFENGVYFTAKEAVASLKRDCEETFLLSKQCTKENTKRRLFGRWIDSLLRLFEGLM